MKITKKLSIISRISLILAIAGVLVKFILYDPLQCSADPDVLCNIATSNILFWITLILFICSLYFIVEAIIRISKGKKAIY